MYEFGAFKWRLKYILHIINTTPSPTDILYVKISGGRSIKGLWNFINFSPSILITHVLLYFNIVTNIQMTSQTSAEFYKEIKQLANDNRVGFFYLQLLDNYESGAEIRLFNESPLIQKSWLNYILHPAYTTNICPFLRWYFRTSSCFPSAFGWMSLPAWNMIGHTQKSALKKPDSALPARNARRTWHLPL